MSSRRGQGFVYRPKYRYKGETKESSIWWISYSLSGKRIRESSGTTAHGEAVRLLNQRLADRGRGVSQRDLEKIVFSDLANAILADYRKNRRKSIVRLENSLVHLRAAFSGWRVVDITENPIDRYAADRLAEDAAPATVNRELAALKRMIRIGRRAKLVGTVPTIEMLEERNVRKGFVEDGQFEALLEELPEHLQPLAVVAFVTGWRKGELLSREWRHVDLDSGWIRLEPGETKNGEARMFPLIPRLRAALEEQRERKQGIERRTGRMVGSLFFFYETGKPVKDFRTAWALRLRSRRLSRASFS